MTLIITNYSGSYLCRDADDIQPMITVEILEFVILATVHSMLYAADEAAPDVYIGL